ncbi:MAG: hydrolase [Actinomycetota bacterium]
MEAGTLDALPRWFWQVPYVGSRFPGAVPRSELARGANCQLWAYGVLDRFGFNVPDLRSDDLWHDNIWTRVVDDPLPLDLVLFNDTHEPYGAHVGLVTEGGIAHLCQEIGQPTVWPESVFATRARYAIRIGFKRPVRRA